MFKKGAANEPLKFEGSVNEGALSAFLKQETGLYIGLPGNIEAFDKLAHGFLALDSAGTAERLARAEEALAVAEESDVPSAKSYIKIMKRVQEKGAGFIDTETGRVKKLMGGKITDKKKELFGERLNILASFNAAKDEL